MYRLPFKSFWILAPVAYFLSINWCPPLLSFAWDTYNVVSYLIAKIRHPFITSPTAFIDAQAAYRRVGVCTNALAPLTRARCRRHSLWRGLHSFPDNAVAVLQNNNVARSFPWQPMRGFGEQERERACVCGHFRRALINQAYQLTGERDVHRGSPKCKTPHRVMWRCALWLAAAPCAWCALSLRKIWGAVPATRNFLVDELGSQIARWPRLFCVSRWPETRSHETVESSYKWCNYFLINTPACMTWN